MDETTITGIFYCFISAISLGSTYIPLRNHDKGDGLYFQWIQSIGQLLIGITVALMSTPTPIHPIAMISGMFYSVGNSLTIFIMDGLGMSIGYLLWNTVTCIVGWAVTRFGLFYNPKQAPRCNWLNILGVITICVGGVIYAPIEATPTKPKKSRKILCFCLTVFVGFLYGNFYSPINYIMSNPEASQDVRTYFLSYCIGSFVTSTVIFLGYCIYKKNVPLVNAELSMPSIVSGLLYGIGMITFFTACQNLDQVIAYPILSKAPGIIVSLWAIFLFKEIQGKKDIIQLYFGIGVTLIGITMISVSKMGV